MVYTSKLRQLDSRSFWFLRGGEFKPGNRAHDKTKTKIARQQLRYITITIKLLSQYNNRFLLMYKIETSNNGQS